MNFTRPFRIVIVLLHPDYGDLTIISRVKNLVQRAKLRTFKDLFIHFRL